MQDHGSLAKEAEGFFHETIRSGGGARSVCSCNTLLSLAGDGPKDRFGIALFQLRQQQQGAPVGMKVE